MPDERAARAADELEIRALLARYARAIDRRDWELLRSCYHADAVERHGSFGVGRAAEFVEWVAERLAVYQSSTHFLGNHLIEIDGDRADAETYCLAVHRRPASGSEPARDELANVRYVDRLERRTGEWRILERTCIFDPGRIDPVWAPYPIAAGADRGVPGPADPSYRGSLHR